jgi:type II secretory pathway pseudopilin PulG
MKTSYARKMASWVAIALLAGCSKKADVNPATSAPGASASVSLIGQAEQSRHFEAVNKHLELGGTLYGYADVDGDVMELANPLQSAMKAIAESQPAMTMFAKQDFKALFTSLGLADVKAVGVSSVHQADGLYRNRAFLYTPEGRHGFFAVFGGEPGPFLNARMAPADADYYGEFDFDLKAIYDTTESVISRVNGPEAASDFRAKVKKVGMDSAFSLLDFIEGLKGRATIIIKFEPTATFTIPKPVSLTLPKFSALFRVDGIGPAVEGAFKANSAKFEASANGSMRIYVPKGEPPTPGMNPMFGFDGNSFYMFTSEGFAAECLSRKDGLDKNPDFAAALGALGPNGNGVSWVTPRLMSRMKEIGSLNETAPKQVHKFLESYSSNLPVITQPLYSVRTNLPDGILMRSMWNRSLKADLALVAVYNPVTVGILAAMVIPAVQKVRQNAQYSAVQNNLRMLSNAADSYCSAHGVISCSFVDLVGPDKAVKSVTRVLGEDYESVIYYKGRPLHVSMSDGRTVFYAPPGASRKSYNLTSLGDFSSNVSPLWSPPKSADPQGKATAIRANLHRLSIAADAYYKATGSSTASLADLVGPGKEIPEIHSVIGENYGMIPFVKGQPVRIATDVGVISYPGP